MFLSFDNYEFNMLFQKSAQKYVFFAIKIF